MARTRREYSVALPHASPSWWSLPSGLEQEKRVEQHAIQHGRTTEYSSFTLSLTSRALLVLSIVQDSSFIHSHSNHNSLCPKAKRQNLFPFWKFSGGRLCVGGSVCASVWVHALFLWGQVRKVDSGKHSLLCRRGRHCFDCSTPEDGFVFRLPVPVQWNRKNPLANTLNWRGVHSVLLDCCSALLCPCLWAWFALLWLVSLTSRDSQLENVWALSKVVVAWAVNGVRDRDSVIASHRSHSGQLSTTTGWPTEQTVRHHSRAAILLLWAKLFEIEFILVWEDVIRPSRTSCRVIKFGSNRLLATGRNFEQDLIYLHRLFIFYLRECFIGSACTCSWWKALAQWLGTVSFHAWTADLNWFESE